MTKTFRRYGSGSKIKKVQDVVVDTSYLAVEMSVSHNNCWHQIESFKNVTPASHSAIYDLCVDPNRIEDIPHVYSVLGPGAHRYFSESLTEIVEKALDLYSELPYHCTPEPAVFKIVITDGRENAMWHQPIELYHVLCPVKFVALEDGSRFPLGSCRSNIRSSQERKNWTKFPDRYIEDVSVWIPLNDKHHTVTASGVLKLGTQLLCHALNSQIGTQQVYEDLEDALSDALEAADFLIRD